MRVASAPFVRAAVASLEHAFSHESTGRSGDLAQVLISVDHMCEMLVKAALLEQGESIFEKRQRTIGLLAALEKTDSPHKAEAEVIHEKRNVIQHLFTYASPEEIHELIDFAWRFADDILTRDLQTELKKHTELRAPRKGNSTAAGRWLEESASTQRDACFAEDLFVWADARDGTLRLRYREEAAAPEWLSSADSFEYMPRTDGHQIAAYRQSGGIVLYQRSSTNATLLTETGAPGDIRGGLIAAQGLGISGGLGGGVWIVPTDGSSPEQISAEGHSPTLADGRVMWAELRNGMTELRVRDIGGGPTETLIRPGEQFAYSGALLTWTQQGPSPQVLAMNISEGRPRTISSSGIFPSTSRGLIAFLEGHTREFDVVVHDWERASELFRAEGVGFPTGRGPLISDRAVICEVATNDRPHNLREYILPERQY